MAAVTATVRNVRGDVFAVNAQGFTRRLKEGDTLLEGEVLVTGPNGSADLDVGGKAFTVSAQQVFTVDAAGVTGKQPPSTFSAMARKIIKALTTVGGLNALIEAEATAAGVTGGGGDEEGGSFVLLLRIAEGVNDPVLYQFNLNTINNLTIGREGGKATTIGVPIAGEYGTLIIDITGVVTYTPGPVIETLREGEIIIDVIMIEDIPVVIEIVGTNDTPVAVADTAVVKEDVAEGEGPVGANGNLLANDTDVDIGDPHSVTAVTGGADGGETADTITRIGTYGTLVVDKATGDYTYTLNNSELNVQSLGEDESVTEVFTYTNSDGIATSDATLTITINGTNDRPVLEVETPGALTEDVGVVFEGEGAPQLRSSVTLSFSDVDANDLVTVEADYNGDATWSGGQLTSDQITALSAGFTVDGDSRGYAIANAVLQFLGEGETITLSFTVTAKDDSHVAATESATRTVTITINGTNDAPEITVRASEGEGDPGDSAGRTLTETNAALSAGGTLTVTDVDLTDEVTPAVASVTSEGPTGGLTNAALLEMLTVDGSALAADPDASSNSNLEWTFDSAPQAFDYLNDGESLTLTYTVRGSDDSGAFDDQAVTITINGTNDAPEIIVRASEGEGDPGDSAGRTLTETNAALSAGGTLTVTDVDLSDEVEPSVESVTSAGPTGGLTNAALLAMLTVTPATIAANPDASSNRNLEWTFDSAPQAFDYLDDGESLTLTYTVRGTDDSGAFDDQAVTITINGTNDAPEIIVRASEGEGDPGDSAGRTLTETNAALTAGGTLTVTDVDLSDEVEPSVESVTSAGPTGGLSNAALLGMLTVDGSALAADPGAGSNSNLAWTFNSAPEAFDYLDDGESLTLTYTVRGTDDSGAFDDQAVTITINGTNDAPEIIVRASEGEGDPGDSAGRTLTETNAALTAGGTLTVTDVDLSDEVTPAVVSVVESGTTSGPDNAALLGMLTVDGSALAADPDASSNSNLAWTFNSAPEAFDYLDDGESLTLTYTVRGTDDSGAFDDQAVTITINGTNDAPEIIVRASEGEGDPGDSAGRTLTETNAALTAGGTLTVTDVDLSDEVTPAVVSVVESGTTSGPDNAALLGMLTVDGSALAADPDASSNSNLAWTFNSAPEAFDYLDDGESLTLTYTVRGTDDSGAFDDQAVTITINGTNDAPEITVRASEGEGDPGDSAGRTLTETNAALSTGGTLTVVDVDLSDEVTPSVASVTSDGPPGGPGNAALLGMLTVDGSALAADPGAGSNSNLAWTFNSAPEAFDYLDDGESLTLTYTVRGTDDSGAFDDQTVTVTINGTNDAPEITVRASEGEGDPGDSDAATRTETNAALSAGGTLTVVDVDLSDEVTAAVQSVTASGTTAGLGSDNTALLAMLTVTAGAIAANPGDESNLEWTFNSAPEAFDYLDENESLTLTYTVRGTDDSGAFDDQTVSVTINGTNDAPEITVRASEGEGDPGDSAGRTLTETNAALSAGGTLTVVDVDLSDEVTPSVASVTSAGPTGGLSNAALLGMLTVDGSALAADPGASSNSNLAWTFNSAPEAFDYLDDGESLTLTYTVRGTDDSGAFDDQTVSVTINGTNDAPEITVRASEGEGDPGDSDGRMLTEGNTPLTASGTLTVTDVDLSDEVTPAVASVTASGTTAGLGSDNAALLAMLSVTPGSIAANVGDESNLDWTFNSNPEAFDYLDDGESLTLTYTVRATDDSGASDDQTVTVTINGTNDGPDISVRASEGEGDPGDSDGRTLTEGNTPLTASGTLTVTDVDLSDEVTPSVASVTASGTTAGLGSDNAALLAMLSVTPGSIAANVGDESNLDWTFNSNPEAFDYLDDGENLTLTYTVRATDDSGASDDQTVTVTINGTNDGPDISVRASEGEGDQGDSDGRTLTEGNTPLTASGTLTVTDVDLSDEVTPAVASVTASGTTAGLGSDNAALLAMLSVTPGSIAANVGDESNLDWTFNSNPEAFDYLDDGESLTLTYTVRATDDSGASDDQTVTVTINGTNDGPDISVRASEGEGDPGDSDGRTLTEGNTPLTASGTLTVVDVDLSDEVTPAVASVTASGTTAGLGSDNAALLAMLSVTPGSIAANVGDESNLDWTFNSNPEAFDYLDDGENLTLTYTVRATDDSGASDDQTVTVTINGTNDGPDISVRASEGEGDPGDSDGRTLTEGNTPLTASGTLTVTDVDLSDEVTPAVASVTASGTTAGLGSDNAALLAMLSVTPGSIAANVGDESNLDWTFNSNPEAFDYLDDGESLTLTYTVRATDDSGASDDQTVTVTINGTNDGPDISVRASEGEGDPGDSDGRMLTETNAALTAGGTLTVTDVDLSDEVTPAVASVTASGTTDGLGSDNAALLAMLTVAPATLAANPGDESNLEWAFNSTPEAFDYLDDGESLTLSYTVRATDDSGASDDQTVTVTINGTNDGPDISVRASEGEGDPGDSDGRTLTEGNPPLTASGTLTVTDVDLSDEVTPAVASVTASGTTDGLGSDNAALLAMLTVAPATLAANPGDESNLEWAFNSTPEAFDYLDDGESLTLTYTVRATDDSGASDDQTVTVTINGTNDGPDISVRASEGEGDPGDSDGRTLTEGNTPLTASGTLTVTDVDLSDEVTPAVASVTASGTTAGLGSDNAALLAMLSVTPGSIAANVGDESNLDWTFNSNPEAFDYLDDGESLTLTYTVRATDDSGASDDQTVTVTINGTNDGPDISVRASEGEGDPGDSDGRMLTETNAALTAGGTLTVTDVDLSDEVTPAVASVTASGTTDGLGSDNAALLAMLTVAPATLAANPGDESNLEWAFNSTPEAFDYLDDGESLTLTYTVRATDDSSAFDDQAVTVTINGSNDGPVISVRASEGEGDPGDSDAATRTETNAALSAGGTLTVTDVDRSDEVTATVQSVTAAGTTGGLGSDNTALLAMLTVTAGAITANAGDESNLEWTFNSDPEAFDYLDENESLTLTYTVRATDDSGAFDDQAVTVTINGSNDGPVISVRASEGEGDPGDSDAATRTETNAALSANGTLTVTDVDLSDEVTAAVQSVTASGTTEGLGSDNTALLVMLTVTAGAIAADTGDESNLEWTFNSDPEAFDYLDDGESLTLTYTVRATDDSGASDDQAVTVTINGSNDGPQISVRASEGEGDPGDSDAATRTETNAALSANGTLTVTDVDLSDEVTAAVQSVTASGSTDGLGSDNTALLAMLTVTAGAIAANAGDESNLEWTFNSDPEAFDYLDENESLTLTYTVRATDDSGAFDDQAVTVTINGSNDGPVISVRASEGEGDPGDSDAATRTETNAALSAGGALTVTDVDLSDEVMAAVQSVSASGTTAGLGSDNAALLAMLTVTSGAIAADTGDESNLAWTFDSAPEAFDYLDENESLTLTYTVRATDDSSAFDDKAVTVTINGSNDGPVISVRASEGEGDPGDSDGRTLTEGNTPLTASGTLTVTDVDLSDEVTPTVASVAATGTTDGLGSNNAALLAMLTVTAGAIAANTGDESNLTWTFNSNPEAFDYLAVGESLTLTYTVRGTDDSNASDDQTVTVTINGSNDSPSVSAPGDPTFTEALNASAQNLSDDGTVTFSDPDESDVVGIASDYNDDIAWSGGTDDQLEAVAPGLILQLTVDTFTANAAATADDGSTPWTYEANGVDLDFLSQGETITFSYAVTATDSQGATDTDTVTMTINGTNDAPEINVEIEGEGEGGDSTGALVFETDAALAASGTLTVIDIDVTDTVTAEVLSPVVKSGTTTGLGSSDAALLLMLTVTPGPIAADAGDEHNLTWTFDSDPEAFDYLAQGETLTLTYTVKVTDDSGVTATNSDTQEVTITISGTNDQPVITSLDDGAVTEDVFETIDLTSLTRVQGFIIQGDAAFDNAGFSVASAGDVNGDGYADLIVGALFGDDGGAEAGEAYVVFGKASGFGTTVGGRQVIDLTSLSAADGFIIQGDSASDQAGLSVASAGDVNNDGIADLIVGAPLGDDGGAEAGEAYVVFGKASGFGTTVGGRQVIDLTSLSAADGFIIQGDSASDQAGLSVASAGDVNNDGIADLIVGAPLGDDGGAEAGEAYVVFGKASGFGTTVGGRQVIDLTSLSAADGFIIQGDSASDQAGLSVASAGDVNNDGYADLIVGAPRGDDGGAQAGEAYVVFGKASGFGTTVGGRQVIDLTSLSAADGFIIQGDSASDQAGLSVASAGDVNNDGIADLIVGAPLGDDGGAEAGEAYVVFGKASGFGTTVGGRQVIDLTSLSAADGFIIQGDSASDQAGFSVASAGDVSGDGYADLIVGAPDGDDGGDSAGEAYVVFGKTSGFGTTVGGRQVIDLGSLSGSDGFKVQGDAEFDRAGFSVASAGDVNGDLIADVIVGAARGDDGGSNAGEAYVIFGGVLTDSGTLSFIDVDLTDTHTVTATGTPTAVWSDGSLDGAQEAAVTSGFSVEGNVWNYTVANAAVQFLGAGETITVEFDVTVTDDSGAFNNAATDTVTITINGVNDAPVVTDDAGSVTEDDVSVATIDLTSLSAAQGFIIQGDAAIDYAGTSVSSAGDVNGDGYADLIVGAPEGSGGGDAGDAYVVFGKAAGFGTVDGTGRAVIDLSNVASSFTSAQGFVIQGDADFDGAGTSVASAGDINGDGFADLIVGAPYGEDGGGNAGEAYVVFGKASGFGTVDGTGRAVIDLSNVASSFTSAQGFVIQGDAASDYAGSVASAGDINGDGFADLIVGAPFGDDGGSNAGEAYVVFGKAAGFGTVDGSGRAVIDLSNVASSFTSAQGFIIQGDAASDRAGRSVASAGDVNGDGIADLIVGAPNGDDGGSNAGEAYVVFGKAAGFGTVDGSGRAVIDLSNVASSFTSAQGFVIQGDAALDYAGFSVASAGDVNGDGYADLIVGARSGDDGGTAAGEAYVVFGKAAGFGTVDGTGRAVIDLSNVASSFTSAQGFVIQGDADFDRAGSSVASAGDVNGDGYADLIVGARSGDDGSIDAGEAYVVFGKAAGFGTVDGTGRAVIDLSNVASSFTSAQGFIIQGDAAFDFAGTSVASAGDVNGDGIADLVVGAPFGNDGGTYAGEAYVIFGGFNLTDSGTLTFTDVDVNDTVTITDVAYAADSAKWTDNTATEYTLSAQQLAAINDVTDNFSVDANGAWEYTVSNALVQFLGAKEQIELSFDVTATDDSLAANDSDTATVTITINGENDAPELEVGRTAATLTLPGTIELETLSPAQGFIIRGDPSYDRAGFSVSSAGDLNGDGFDDMIVGAYGYYGYDGAAYVVFGKAGGFGELDGSGRRVVDVESLAESDGFVITGKTGNYEYAGLSVSSAGDVNGDGWLDLIIGAPLADGASDYTGTAYVVLGSASGFGAPVGGRQVVDLDNLAPLKGFSIIGDTPDGYAGVSVSSAGDLNGDGVDDLIVGASGALSCGCYATGDGEAYVVYGKDLDTNNDGNADSAFGNVVLATLAPSAGYVIQKDLDGVAYSSVGFSVSAAGDVNGDGIDDIIVGDPLDDSSLYNGLAYVIFGDADGFTTDVDGRAVLELDSLDPTDGFVLTGYSYDTAGWSVSSAGDVNGDGIDDLLVGAPRGYDYSGLPLGKAYVVFGKDLDANNDGVDEVGNFGDVNLATLDGTQGFVLEGRPFNQAGWSVDAAGDVNGDGFDDLIIGEPDFAGYGPSYSGGAYVVYGKAGGFGTLKGVQQVVDLTGLAATDGFGMTGAPYDEAGMSVSSAGDVNGDGFDDVMVGAPGYDGPFSGGYVGDTYVIFGSGLKATGTIAFDDVDANDTVTISTDYNGDAVWKDANGATIAGFDPAPFSSLTTNFTVALDVDADPTSGTGRWNYTVDAAELQFLGAGETITLSFDITAKDNSGAVNDSDTERVTITLVGWNDAPVAVDDAVSTTQNTPVFLGDAELFGGDLEGPDNDFDVDTTDTFDYITIIFAPQDGTLFNGVTSLGSGDEVPVSDIEAGLLRYDPDFFFAGSDDFIYTVTDANGAESNWATVDIDVQGIDAPPPAPVPSIAPPPAPDDAFRGLGADTFAWSLDDDGKSETVSQASATDADGLDLRSLLSDDRASDLTSQLHLGSGTADTALETVSRGTADASAAPGHFDFAGYGADDTSMLATMFSQAKLAVEREAA